MEQRGLTSFFESFLRKEQLFSNKAALQGSFMPETIKHRDFQIEQIANILAPTFRLEKPSNIFIYGKTGTGKTLITKHVTNSILEMAKQKNLPITIFYLNCKLKRIADTEYRLIAQLARELGKAIPPTGLPTDEVYKIFLSAITKENKLIVLVLDEIDQLVKKAGDEILYNLTRLNEELKDATISIIGISNSLTFKDNLDPRIKSSLSEEEVLFPPYNALQLQDILRERAKLAFRKDIIEEGVIEKCSAYAAHDHGDARRALELLRVAGEVAERKGFSKVKIKHIDEAEEKIERDRIMDIAITQPKQQQAILYAILSIYLRRRNVIHTGEVYEVYKGICLQTGLRPLTQRRVSDVIAELDMLGVINIKVISKGRYGRTREISLAVPPTNIPKIKRALEGELELS